MSDLEEYRKSLQSLLHKLGENLKIGSALRDYIGNVTDDFLLCGRLLKSTKALYTEMKSFQGSLFDFCQNFLSPSLTPLLHTLEDILSRGKESDSQFVSLAKFYFQLHHLLEKVNALYTQSIYAGEHSHTELVIDNFHPIWRTMKGDPLTYPSQMDKIRVFSREMTSPVPEGYEEKHLLTQQVSEIVKNAMRHGNKKNPKKHICVYREWKDNWFHIVVKDEGKGFLELEKWNEFNKKRLQAITNQDLDSFMSYAQWKGKDSTQEDGGNSLFAALEYWDSGIVFRSDRTTVGASKYLGGV